MPQRDPYEVLGVSRDAPDDEIRRAYLKLAHRYHPDKTGGDKAAEDKLKQVNAAYDILKNPEKRRQYDQLGDLGDGFAAGAGASRGGFGGFSGGFESSFDDLFGMFFGRGGGARRRAAPTPGNDLMYALSITLEEAAFGAKKTIRFSRMETCGDCSGTGAAPGSRPEACPKCQGSGQVRMAHGFFSVTQTCPMCYGEGKVISKPCPRCSGSGLTRTERELPIDVPAGVDTGLRLRVPNEGEPGRHGGPPGNLDIVIEVRPHEFFKRDGNDIICEIPVSFPQAALGATIRVPTLNSETELKIPPGTQPGDPLTLRGLGIPDVRGYRQGNQICRIIVEVPAKLSRKQKDLLKEFEEESDKKNYPRYRRFAARLKKSRGG